MLRAFIAAFSSLILLLLVIFANASLDEELVFYLTFDNIKNQTIIDESGNGLDAEILERADIVKGKYGDAIRLTGQSADCVNIPAQGELKVIGKITMMAWIYSPETRNNEKMHWLEKDCHFVVPIGWAHCYGIGGVDIRNGPEIFMLLGSHVDGEWEQQGLQTPHKMDEKKWHHVVGSYDGETMKIYIDGKVIAAEKKKFEFFGDNEADVRIGCAKDVPHLTFTNGSIDEAAVWQRALSNDEIKQAMTGNFLAVSPRDKVATTWADVKRRTVTLSEFLESEIALPLLTLQNPVSDNEAKYLSIVI